MRIPSESVRIETLEESCTCVCVMMTHLPEFLCPCTNYSTALIMIIIMLLVTKRANDALARCQSLAMYKCARSCQIGLAVRECSKWELIQTHERVATSKERIPIAGPQFAWKPFTGSQARSPSTNGAQISHNTRTCSQHSSTWMSLNFMQERDTERERVPSSWFAPRDPH